MQRARQGKVVWLISSGTLTPSALAATRSLLNLESAHLFDSQQRPGNVRIRYMLLTGNDEHDYALIRGALVDKEPSIVFVRTLDKMGSLLEHLMNNT